MTNSLGESLVERAAGAFADWMRNTGCIENPDYPEARCRELSDAFMAGWFNGFGTAAILTDDDDAPEPGGATSAWDHHYGV